MSRVLQFAANKRNFASKYAFDSIFQALQDVHTFAMLQSQHFGKKSAHGCWLRSGLKNELDQLQTLSCHHTFDLKREPDRLDTQPAKPGVCSFENKNTKCDQNASHKILSNKKQLRKSINLVIKWQNQNLPCVALRRRQRYQCSCLVINIIQSCNDNVGKCSTPVNTVS